MSIYKLLAAAVVVAVASIAQAQTTGPIDGRFIDDRGRSVQIFLGGPPVATLAPGSKTADLLAAEFKRLCIDPNFDKTAFDQAAQGSAWNFSPVPFELRLGKKQEISIDIGGWQSSDASVRMTNLDRVAPGLQCNLTVASQQITDWAALTAALGTALQAEAKYTSGGKNWGQATWSLPSESGNSRLVGLRIDGLNRPMQTLHVGVIQVASKQ